jgi:hypothetical protein
VQGFVFLANRCYSITPTGYYNNTGYATLCSTSADCATCVNQASNCTSCISLNLEGNICTNSCSAGKVGINKVCVNISNNSSNESHTNINLFPVPFTTCAIFISIICILSKFKHSYTFIAGSLLSFCSLL